MKITCFTKETLARTVGLYYYVLYMRLIPWCIHKDSGSVLLCHRKWFHSVTVGLIDHILICIIVRHLP